MRLERLRGRFAYIPVRTTAFPLAAGLSPALILILVAAVLLMIVRPGAYVLSIATLTLIYAIVALGYNLVLTVAGLFHFGFAAHFAIGGYAAAILMVRLGWQFLPALAAVIVISGILTALMAFPTLRFRGDYLAMVTLAFAEIVRRVIVNWKSLTNGPLGISGIPLPNFFSLTSISPEFLFGVVAALAALSFFAYQNLVSSRFGLAWEAIRLNEEAAAAAGLHTWRYKLGALIVGSLFAGIAGMAYGHYASITDPSMSNVDTTILFLAVVILSGGTWLGILLASLVLTALPQVFLGLDLYRQLALGLVLIVVMNLRPQGFSLLRKRGYASTDSKPDVSMKQARRRASHPRVELIRSTVAPIEGVKTRASEVHAGNATELAVDAIRVMKRFGGLVAVDGLVLQVPMSAIFGIIGPNGAGKTTVFNLLTGSIPADAGEIRILGQDVKGWPSWKIARLGVGRTFQNVKLFSTLSALDNVLVTAAQQAYGKPFRQGLWREAVAKAKEAIAFTGLGGREGAVASSLPYADQRRLELARALASDPRLILLDEPSAGMNPRELRELRTLVEEIRVRGITVICIEHNMGFILPIADEILVMAEGKRLTIGSPDAITKDPKVIEAYLGRRAARAAS